MNTKIKDLVRTLSKKTPDDIKFKFILVRLGKDEITVEQAIDEINKLDSINDV